MKKVSPILLLFLQALILACSSESDTELISMDPVDEVVDNGDTTGGGDTTTSLNYVDDISPIMSENCFACHGNRTTQGAPMSLTTYTEVVDAINKRALIDRINSTTNPMPRSGLMPIETEQLIQKWVDEGLLEQ